MALGFTRDFLVIQDELSDTDLDTRIRVESVADEDIIRVDVGDSPVGYGAVSDILLLSASAFTLAMGTANVVATAGAPVSITAGSGNTSGDGGDITLTAGTSPSGSAGSVVLPDQTAPSVTTNKIYSVGGSLFWNGVDLTGAAVGYLVLDGSGNVVGTDTTYSGSGDHNLLMLTNAGDALTTGIDNIAIGEDALGGASSADSTVAIGFGAGRGITTGNYNIAIGHLAIGRATPIATGADNVAIGRSTLLDIRAGTVGNIAIGALAGTAVQDGNYNIMIGEGAGQALTDGNNNILMGQGAGSSLTTTQSIQNIIMGEGAGDNLSGSAQGNIIMGADAGSKLIALATHNIIIGEDSVGGVAASATFTGTRNIVIGIGAFTQGTLTSAFRNTIIGYTAGTRFNTDSQFNVAIGNAAGPSTVASYSNQLWIHNTFSDTPLIKGHFTDRLLTINGDFVVVGNASATPVDSSITAAAGTGTATGAALNLTGGASGNGLTGDGGDIAITAGSSVATNGSGADITLTAGVGAGSGSAGSIVIPNQTAPTVTTNKLYSVAGALTWNGTDLTAGGGGDAIADADADTQIQVEETADEDIIRFDTGDNITGFPAAANMLLISSGQFTLALPTANVVATAGAPISLTAGTGNTSAAGGALSLTAGAGGASGDGGAINLTAGAGGGVSDYGGNISITAGVGGYQAGSVTITGGAGAVTGYGGNVSLIGGLGATNGSYDGGTATLQGGNAAGSPGDTVVAGGSSLGASAAGGTVAVTGGVSQGGGGAGGAVSITGTPGAGSSSAIGGAVTIQSGNGGSGGGGAGGVVTITTGGGTTTANAGALTISTGAGGATSGSGGALSLTAGSGGAGATGDGGDLNITAGNSAATNGGGGDITLTAGTATGSGSTGAIVIPNQTAPGVTTNKLYSVAGALTWNGTDLTAGAGGALADADGDTQIQVEEGADDDTIRFDTGDTPTGYGAETDLLIISSAQFTLAYGVAGSIATKGASISMTAGAGNSSGHGGDITFTGGASGSSTADGGDVSLLAGTGATGVEGGNIILTAGLGGSPGGGKGGDVVITAGLTQASAIAGGGISLTSGAGSDTSNGGAITLTAADGGAGATGNGGAISVISGDSASTNGNGGNIDITAGDLTGSGVSGTISLNVGTLDGIVVTELNNQVLIAYDTDLAITAFATGGQTNAVQLDANYSVITVSAADTDSVKLPLVFLVGTLMVVKNDDAAQAIDIFPGLGDDLGAGTNTAVSLAFGNTAIFLATVANATWTQLL